MDAKVIDYQRPTLADGQPKAVKMLARTDRAFFAVQVVNSGGENNLHSHEHVDGFWFVLSGRARFYTTGDEPLEILQFEASDIPFGQPNEDRVDHAPQKAWMNFGGGERTA